MFHLDTDTAIFLLRGNVKVSKQLEFALPDVGMSTLVLAELLFGVRCSSDPDYAIAQVNNFVRSLHIVDFDSRAATAYGDIRNKLRQRGRPIGDMDTLIAAVAVANRAILVTHNNEHHSQIDELSVVDWVE